MQVNTNSLNPLGTAVASSAAPVAATTTTSPASATTASTSDMVTLSDEAKAKLAAEQTETDTAVTTLGGWGNEPPAVQPLGGWGNEPPK